MFRTIAIFCGLELAVTAATYFSSAYSQILFHIDVWVSLVVVLVVMLSPYFNPLKIAAFLLSVAELILVAIAVALHGYQGVQLLDLFFSAVLTGLTFIQALRSRAFLLLGNDRA